MKLVLYVLLCAISCSIYSEDMWVDEKILHKDSIDSICVKENSFVTASFDGYVNEYLNNQVFTVTKHKDWVRGILCIDGNIVSVSNSGVISLTDKQNKTRSVFGHNWWISEIAYSADSNKLITVSLDEFVKVWSYPSLKLLFEHKIYGSHKHHTVTVHSGKAYIGSTGGHMYVLDLDTYSLESWLLGAFGKTTSLKPQRIGSFNGAILSSISSPKYIYFGDSNGYLIQINPTTLAVISKMKVSDSSIKGMNIIGNKLYIGSNDGYLKSIVADPMGKVSIVRKFNEAIRTIAKKNNHIYLGFDKGIVRIMELKNK